jgi:hypothetical protein
MVKRGFRPAMEFIPVEVSKAKSMSISEIGNSKSRFTDAYPLSVWPTVKPGRFAGQNDG